MLKTQATTIDQFIATFPPYVQVQLELLRETIRQAAPDATECINYGIPTFQLHGNLVHFSGYKKHIGFYPGPSGMMGLEDRLVGYKKSKGAIHFALHAPLPVALIRDIVLQRVQQNKDRFLKKTAKTCKKGHVFFKSSDCPVCPVCTAESTPQTGFLAEISAPARRAFERKGIHQLEQLSDFREQEVAGWHGVGPKVVSTLRTILAKKGLSFAN